MVIEFQTGIDPGRLEEWFATAPMGSSCHVTLERLSPAIHGSVTLPRSWLRMEGDEEELQELHHRFVMRFVSAGG